MKILVISPHADDEVLGCGGYIKEMARQGHEIHVVVACIGPYVNFSGITQLPDEKKIEVSFCHDFLGVTQTDYWFDDEGLLDTVPERDIVKKIDDKLNEGFDQFFIPYRSQHVDHKVLHDCCLAALRLKSGKAVENEVYFYEYPFINGYDKIDGGATYFPMTEEQIEDKVKAFYFYKSQVKESPSPLNRDGVLTLAKMRGMEVGLRFAEKFYLRHKIL